MPADDDPVVVLVDIVSRRFDLIRKSTAVCPVCGNRLLVSVADHASTRDDPDHIALTVLEA